MPVLPLLLPKHGLSGAISLKGPCWVTQISAMMLLGPLPSGHSQTLPTWFSSAAALQAHRKGGQPGEGARGNF